MFTKEQAEKISQELVEYMLDNEEPRCLCCLASMKKNSHSLTSGMITGLMKFANNSIKLNLREANPRKDMLPEFKLSINEMTNWTKLRFFGLVAKYKENGIHKNNNWLITRNGWAFLRGDLSVPKQIFTFRNKIVEKSIERIAFYDIYGSQPTFPHREDLFSLPIDGEDLDVVKVAKKKERKKKRKNPCPKCENGTIKKSMEAEIVDGVARVSKFEKCDTCGYSRNYQNT